MKVMILLYLFRIWKNWKFSKNKRKIFRKIIKTPFLVWSYANDKDTVYLSDRGYISEYQSIRDSSSCHLVDEKTLINMSLKQIINEAILKSLEF